MVHQRNYAPPPLPQQVLCRLLFEAYPSHKTCKELIKLLVEEYAKLWLLIREYPSRRIVAPGAILAVQDIHRSDEMRKIYNCEIYSSHCIDYLGYYLYKEAVWDNRFDHRGTVDTMRAYHDCFHNDPPLPWQQMVEAYDRGGQGLRLVVNNT